MFRTLFRGWIVVLFAGMGVPVVHAQRAGTTLRDSVGDAAAALLNDGRTNEARIALMRALRAGTDPAQKATYRLELGDTFLFDGQYGEAARAYNAVLAGTQAVTVDSLVRWAHHGLALVDAFNGRSARAATHFVEALKGPTSLTDNTTRRSKRSIVWRGRILTQRNSYTRSVV